MTATIGNGSKLVLAMRDLAKSKIYIIWNVWQTDVLFCTAYV